METGPDRSVVVPSKTSLAAGGAGVDSQRGRIEDFLYDEARLLDEGEFEGWLSLFSDDALYWIPARWGDIDPTCELSLVYDDRKHLEERVWRLTTSRGPRQDPTPRTVRIIANVHVQGVADGSGTVRSSSVVFEA